MKRFLHLAPLVVLALTISLDSIATTVLPLGVERLTALAETILHVRVLANRTGQDQATGQIVTYTDFAVIEALKGEAGAQHSIKQLGGKLAGTGHSPVRFSRQLNAHGVPSFTVGKEYVVFLPKPSNFGFCSPLGLQQGRFSVMLHNDRKVVTNGQPLNSPTRSLRPSASRLPLAVDAADPRLAGLDDFIHAIKALNTRR